MTEPRIGFIYQITTPGDECYVGSTCSGVSQRFQQHKYHYKQWLGGKASRCSSFSLFEKYGPEQCGITVLEVVNFRPHIDLRRRERHWLDNTPHVVNTNRPLITKEDHLESMRQWRKKNKEYNRSYLAQTVVCPCGIWITLGALALHKKSDVHLRRIAENPRAPTDAKDRRADIPIITCGCGAKLKSREFSGHRKTQAHVIWEQAQKSKELKTETQQ